MKRKIYILLLILNISVSTIFGQLIQPRAITWDGYTQLRFTSNFDNLNSFSIRRMKLWVQSDLGLNQHWNFKIQANLSSLHNEEFSLENVLVTYNTGQFKLFMGQFIPAYSLQKFQSDYKIPLTERSTVIDKLIPDGTLGSRDIGIQGYFHSADNKLEIWAGLFNGYGIKEYRFDNNGFMIDQKTAVHLVKNRLTAGYSLMHRKADQLNIPGVLPDLVAISGNDFRYNLFVQFHQGILNIQSEYLYGQLNGQAADGYYLLASLSKGKSQFACSWNKYNDLIASTSDNPVLHLGYNYLINKDKIKIMTDNSFQITGNSVKFNAMILQFQLFFK